VVGKKIKIHRTNGEALRGSSKLLYPIKVNIIRGSEIVEFNGVGFEMCWLGEKLPADGE
jgi:hypothetical protein